MKHFRTLLIGLGLALAGCAVNAASLPSVNQQQLQIPAIGADLQSYTNTLNANVPGFSSLPAGTRNYLDNGAMFAAQRGTGTVTGGTTSGCAVLSYVADRWCIDTNVSSGDGRGAVITSTPSPPPGFQNSMKMFRNSGALLQPVCALQEIESARFTQLQGKMVIFSAYVQPLAGFTAASGAISATLITGTGTDQGLGALRSAVGMTASPAITPVWTGLASTTLPSGAGLSINSTTIAQGTSTYALGTTAAWNRIYSQPTAVPATATEGAIAICFTPVGSSSGTTDGIAFTGAMLEQADNAQTAASMYEFLPQGLDLDRAQRFYWQIADPAATVPLPSSCFVTAANTTVKCGVFLPKQMQTAPVTAISTATSFGIVVTAGTAGTCTTLAATASSNTVTSIGVTCTTGGTIALGSATPLIGAATAGNINASADF